MASTSIDEPPRYPKGPLPDGWEIGDRLPAACAYITLPIHKFQHATARFGELTVPVPPRDAYSSRPLHRDLAVQRLRREVQREPGKGWPAAACGRSEFHPNALDYRTVDELGLTVEKLEELQVSRTAAARQHAEQVVDDMLVEGAELQQLAAGFGAQTSLDLESGKPMMGEIRPALDTQYCFFQIVVPQCVVPVGLLVTLKKTAGSGDPDLLVCNRTSQPRLEPHLHTWRSQDAGDDRIFIPPYDPLYLPGPFYISVYANKECTFAVQCDLIEHQVHLRTPLAPEGNGFRDVKKTLLLADTRRRFCRTGAGFLEQLDSPRALHPKPDPSEPPPSRLASASPRSRAHLASARPSARLSQPTGPQPPHSAPNSARACFSESMPNGFGGAGASSSSDVARPWTVSAEGRGAEGRGKPVEAPPSSGTGAWLTPAAASLDPPLEGVAALPPAMRQKILGETVRAATPRGRPPTSWPRSDRGGNMNHTAPAGADTEAAVERAHDDALDGATEPSAAGDGAHDGAGSMRPESALQLFSPRSTRQATLFAETDALESVTPRVKEPPPVPSLPSARVRAKREGEPLRIAKQSIAGVQVAAMIAQLQEHRDKARQPDDETLSELEKLYRSDTGGDVLATVRAFLAAQHNVSPEVLETRAQISMSDRVPLNQSEFIGLQNMLTHRLRKSLNTQADARRTAYRLKAKASHHLELESVANWNAGRALSLVTRESLRMKSTYDAKLVECAESLVQQQEEESKEQQRSAARLKMRTTMKVGLAAVRMLRKSSVGHQRPGIKRESTLGAGLMRRN